MPGLIETKLPTGNQSIKTPDSTLYDPSLREVEPGKETVAGQLHSLLTSGSPYLERARASSLQTANRRGLINSSIAAGAGESAAIEAALPIATSDANIYGTAARENQSYRNQAASQGAQSASQIAGIAATGEQQRLSQQLQGSQEMELQTLKGNQAKELAEIEAQYKNMTQTSASASAIFTQVSKNITDILNDPNTSTEQKQAAVDHQKSLLQSQLHIIGQIASIDLAGLLDFSGTTTQPAGEGQQSQPGAPAPLGTPVPQPKKEEDEEDERYSGRNSRESD